jgi:hypothetical protein
VNYEVWHRQSSNNGLTWKPDEVVSSVLIPQPQQPDPNVQACYAGDYNYATSFGTGSSAVHYATWTDGRVQVSGVNQQDVFFAKIPISAAPLTLSVSLAGSGSVASSPAGINCPGTCSANFASGTNVTLTESPGGGWTFGGWSGACSGSAGCVVAMTTNQSVMATFWTNGSVVPFPSAAPSAAAPQVSAGPAGQ